MLDRANTIEFNNIDLSYNFEEFSLNKVEHKIYYNDFLKSDFLKIVDCKEYKDIALKVIEELVKINNILKPFNQQFGFRVRDEIVFYIIYALKDNVMDFNKALDYSIVQKILPKISGSDIETLEILIKLFNLLNNTNLDVNLEEKDLENINVFYKLTSEKLKNMIRRFLKDGFTTFWQC